MGKQNNIVNFGFPGFFGCSGVPGALGCSLRTGSQRGLKKNSASEECDSMSEASGTRGSL